MVLDCLAFLIWSNLWMLESADQQSDCGKAFMHQRARLLQEQCFERHVSGGEAALLKKASPQWNRNQKNSGKDQNAESCG